MHGYELMSALEQRSGGRWRPSPGAIYPALGKLETHGLIDAEEIDGKKQYRLTDTGRERVAELKASDGEAPWEQHGHGHHGELRRAVGELTGPARQIGRYGSAEQVAAAVSAIKQATSKLYQILADGATDNTSADD